MRCLRWLPVLWLLSLLPLSAPAGAQAVGGTATWRGLGNGVPVEVTVIARGHTIADAVRQTSPWWQWGNTTTDAYLFNFGASPGIDLILDFALAGDVPKATIYVTSKEQRNQVILGPAGYSLPQGLRPVLIIRPRQSSWLIDGQANFDLEMEIIDPASGTLLSEYRFGAERPGLPKWVTWTLRHDPHPDRGYPRFGAVVREDPGVLYELAEPLMPTWPYLSTGRREGHWDKNQPLFFDRDERSLVHGGIGFHIAGMYQINSLAYPPATNFEAPFTFYRFDPLAGRYANLVMRSDVWPATDTAGPSLPGVQRTAIRMTWTGAEPGIWRYSLSMAGNHVMDERAMVGPIMVNAIPYHRYPTWASSRAWKAVTFVEATEGETGSEGIYDFSVEDNPPVTQWINGRLSEPPMIFRYPYLRYPTIHPERLKEGMRGEYSLVYDRVPQLYLSPVDNRVHLLHAQEGIWNLGDRRMLRTHNLSGGPYIEGWTRELIPEWQLYEGREVRPTGETEIEEALYVLGDYRLYSGPEGVVVQRTAAGPLGQPLPVPVDAPSWRAFLAPLAPASVMPRDPMDLRSWLATRGEAALAITEAQMEQVRVLPNGFRFVLTLEPGFRALGDSELSVAALEPGSYVVVYDGAFTVTPLTPARLSWTVPNDSLRALERGPVHVSLHNHGLEDLPPATLELWASPSGAEPKLMATGRLTLLGKSSTTVMLEWAPPRPGRWQIIPVVRWPDGQTLRLDEGWLTVRPAAPADPGQILGASSPLWQLPFAGGALVIIALLATFAFRRGWGGSG